MTALSQAAINEAMSEQARGQQLGDTEDPHRRLSTYGLHRTECIEGQSFTIVSSRSPYLGGCYTESGLGRVIRGEYSYVLSESATNDTNNTNQTTAVVGAFLIPGLPDVRVRLSPIH